MFMASDDLRTKGLSGMAKLRHRERSSGLGRLIPLVLTYVGLCAPAGCGDQPKTNCLTSTSSYAMRLIETGRKESAPGACTGVGPAAFNADPEVGFTSYYAQNAKGQPDYGKGSLAIQTTEIGNLVFTAEDQGVMNAATDGTRYSLGPYTVSVPDDHDFCPVPTLSPTHVVLPEIPAVTDPMSPFPGQPAVNIKLEWSNVFVYLTAASFGTQVQADLVDTRVTPAGTCAISYRTVAMAPAVSCAMLDADGNPVLNDDGSTQLDPTLCDPAADPAKDRFVGSGISPNTLFMCDPTTAFCLLASDTVPALK